MFWGSFVNNLDFGFEIVGISMVCRDWMVKILVRMAGMVRIILGMVGRLKLVGLCTKAGRLTAHGNFLPKMEINSRNYPL